MNTIFFTAATFDKDIIQDGDVNKEDEEYKIQSQ